MKTHKLTMLAGVLLLAGTLTARAWQPSGWVYFSWPYAYDHTQGTWFYLNETDEQWCYGYAPVNSWAELDASGLASGWSWHAWPYAYGHDSGAWYYINESDTQRCLNMGTAQWSVFGAPTSSFAPVAKTGQTVSYHANDDGELQTGVAWPVPRFTVQSNAVVDNLTGLMWVRDAGQAINLHWSAAVAWAQDLVLDGLDDWRLPSANECESLFSYNGSASPLPAGHPFLNVKSKYFTSTTVASDTSKAWRMALYHPAAIDERGKGEAGYGGYSAWPVRGPVSYAPSPVRKTGQTTSYVTGDDGDQEAGASVASNRFVSISASTVRDTLTGLTWAKNASLYATTNWCEALDYCEQLSIEGMSGWRLPSTKELQSLIDYGRSFPALPVGHPFQGVQAGIGSAFYFTGTYGYAGADYPYVIDLSSGWLDDAFWINAGWPGQLYVWPVK